MFLTKELEIRRIGGSSDATEGDVTRGKWSEICKFAGLNMKEGGHQLTIVSGFERLEKSRKQISPRDSKK